MVDEQTSSIGAAKMTKLFTFLFTSICVVSCANGRFHIVWKPKPKSVQTAHKRDVLKIKQKQQPQVPSVISGDKTGTLVTEAWMQKYKRYEAKFGTIPEDAEIWKEGEHYRVSSKVSDHFSDMVRKSSP